VHHIRPEGAIGVNTEYTHCCYLHTLCRNRLGKVVRCRKEARFLGRECPLRCGLFGHLSSWQSSRGAHTVEMLASSCTLAQTWVRTSMRFPRIAVTGQSSFSSAATRSFSHDYFTPFRHLFPLGDSCACGMTEDAVQNPNAKTVPSPVHCPHF